MCPYVFVSSFGVVCIPVSLYLMWGQVLCIMCPNSRVGLVCISVSLYLIRGSDFMSLCVSLNGELLAGFQCVFVINVSMCPLWEKGEWVTDWVLVCVRVLPWG